MKLKVSKIKLLLAGLLFAAATANTSHAQMLQTSIASKNRNELITKIRTLADGTAILGGYIYDVTSGNVINADMILLRVTPNGNILWQKQFGTTGSNVNDLLQGMTLTSNEDIVVVGTVGRSSVYVNNTAAIFRFDKNGNLLWSNFVRSNTTATNPGNIFTGVAELSNGNIIAVGADTYTPSSSKSMICLFNGSGTLLYNETYDRNNSDEFLGVCATGNNALITGWYDGSTYKDMRVGLYQPGTTGGSFTWDKSYDITGASNSAGTSLQSSGFSSPYIRGSKVILSGSLAQTWSPSQNMEAFFECDLSDGGNATVRGLDNGASRVYANNTAFYPTDENHFFAAQNPSTAFQDATVWTNPLFSNGVISEINPFQASNQIMQSKEFTLPGNQSVLDMTMGNGLLYLGGCTAATTNNDIYFVVSHTNLKNPNGSCALDTAAIKFIQPVLSDKTTSDSKLNFTNNNTFNITYSDPGLASTTICGETITVDTSGGGSDNCSSQCYWRVDGNSSIGASNVLGTLNNQDIRMVTNGTQRAVLERTRGNFGINTTAPTAHLHVLCQPANDKLSDIRFEKLGDGSGQVLVIDDFGYVYKSPKAAARTMPGNTDSLLSVISQLQKDVAYLMRNTPSTSSGAVSASSTDVTIYPNPANNYAELVVNGDIKATTCMLLVVDVSGKTLIQQPANLNENRRLQINTTNLLPGNYFVKLVTDSKTLAVKNLVIQK